MFFSVIFFNHLVGEFWYDLKSWVARHYLDILVTIALIIAERLFSRWRAKKHQSNIRYRERIRQKYREARRKKNFWLDPFGTIANLPFFAVLGSRLGEDGQIETEMEEWGSQNVIIPNAPNAPNQPQKKISKILALAKKNSRLTCGVKCQKDIKALTFGQPTSLR